MIAYSRLCLLLIFIVPLSLLFGEVSNLSLVDIQAQYDSVRSLVLVPDKVVEVDGLLMDKDAAEFEFESGRIYFFRPIAGRIVGAYFEGTGVFRLSTDNAIERQQILRFTGQENVEEDFQQALFLFNDKTYEHISKFRNVISLTIPDTVQDIARHFRDKIRDRFSWNFDARIIADLTEGGERHFFSAFLECVDDKKLVYLIDPVDEEEVTLARYEKIKFSKRAYWETWYSSSTAGGLFSNKIKFDITELDMAVSIDTRQSISVSADMMFKSLADGARIVPMKLESVLRVESAVIDDKDTCLFIQEDKTADGDLWLVFPKALKKGDEHKLTIIYSGKGILEDIGGDNFAVMARTSWYPSFYTNPKDPRRFVLRFAVPEKMTLLATGNLIESWYHADTAFSIWDSEVEHDDAGFNYGKFSMVSEKSKKCVIDCYTNVKLSDDLLGIRRLLEQYRDLQAALMLLPHELTTDRLGKNAAIESRNAYEIFAHFFGEIPLRKLKVSQQPQMSFAQSWPTLIYLPFTAFWDESLKERLGLVRGEASVMSYETLASHEIAHQWWGNTLFRSSYHDEWLLEGFATYSAALYLQLAEGTDRFKDYMRIQRQQVLAKADKGRSYNDLGPIWLGDRLNSLDFPVGRRLIYSKGAYVLHMLRMMMMDYDSKSDERFTTMMKDYVKTYTGKVVTTDDFKYLVEKHMGMEMDWFFDQWVYGTEMPIYRFDYDVEEEDGHYLLTIYAQQSNVASSFEMPVPFVVNFKNGHSVVHVNVKGLRAIGRKFRLPQKPISVEPNPWNAVLCTVVEWE